MTARLAAAVAVLLLCACTSQSPRASPGKPAGEPTRRPRPAGEIVAGVIGEPATLDPYSPRASDLTLALVRPVYPSLFRLLPSGEARPSLARAISEEGDHARVELRRAQWSDGRSITARDVVSSIRRARAPSGLAKMTAARVEGPRRVVLEGAVRDWRVALGTAAPIVPADGRRVFGGPYVIAGRTPGLEVVYEPNPRWWGPPVGAKRVRVRHVAALDIMLTLLETGRLDAALVPASVNIGPRLDAAGIRWEAALGWERVWADFSDSDLARSERLAVAGALNRAAMATVFLRTGGRLATTLFPQPGPDGARGPWRRSFSRADPPLEVLEIAAPRDDELLGLYQEAFYEGLRRAGIRSDLIAIDSRELYGGWLENNPVDIALERSAGAPGRPSERAAFAAFDALPLAQVETIMAWRDEIKGPRPNPTIEGPFWNLQRWRLVTPEGG